MKSNSVKFSVGGAIALAVASSVIITFIFIKNVADAPIDSIKTYQPAHDYGESFWIKEYKANSNLWNEAITYCDTNQTPTPGCIEVEDTRAGIDVRTLAKYEKIRY